MRNWRKIETKIAAVNVDADHKKIILSLNYKIFKAEEPKFS